MKFFKNVTRLVVGASTGVASAALFSSLFLASGADAAPMPMSPHGSSNATSNVYASIQYYGDFFTNMGDFKGHENASGSLTGSVHGYDKSGNAMIYKPDYITDYAAGGISIGYSMGGPRIEIEGQYANVEVDDDGYTVKDNAKYLELTRNDDIAGTYSSATTDKALGANQAAFSISSTTAGAKAGTFAPPATAVTLTTTDHLAAKFTNDGMRFIGGFVNFGYDVPVANAPVTPFVVLGLGFAQTKFLGEEVYGLAYQAKAGVAYNVSNNFNIFVAYNYRGSFAKEYKEVTLNTPIVKVPAGATGIAPTAEVVASSDATVETTFGVHGLMAGVTLKF